MNETDAVTALAAIVYEIVRRRAERRALDGRLQHAGQPVHVAHRQEQVLHEALDAVLPAARRVAHAGADHRLEVEGQPLLRAPGDVVEVEADGPEEVPGAADGARLVLGEQPAARAVRPHQLRHPLRAEGVAGEPVERLEVAQAPAPLLHVRLHHVRAVAVARVALGARRGELVEAVAERDLRRRIEDLLLVLLPRYKAEGKSYVTVGIGCTGGRHRSVHVASRIAERLRREGFSPTLSHRDLRTAPQDSLDRSPPSAHENFRRGNFNFARSSAINSR